jgi:AmiR/NasT family two-component response regulator
VIPQLRSALIQRVVVEQAKGYLRERFDISVDEAFTLLRRYARTHGDHLSDVARQLMADPSSRPALLEKMNQLVHG